MKLVGKILLVQVLVAEILAVLILGGALAGRVFVLTPLRDMAVAMVADHLAGEAIPLDAPHSYDALFRVYDTITNSKLMGEWAYQILPFFAIESISNGNRYPRTVLLAPNVAQRSFVVAGTAHCEEGEVWLNDRFLDDRAQMLATLTHELIHIQMGNFCVMPDQ